MSPIAAIDAVVPQEMAISAVSPAAAIGPGAGIEPMNALASTLLGGSTLAALEFL